MHHQWLHVFPTFHHTATTVWALERLHLGGLQAACVCAHVTPTWYLYLRVGTATSNELAHIAQTLALFGDRLDIGLHELRGEALHLVLAGPLNQISEGLRVLAGYGQRTPPNGALVRGLRHERESSRSFL